MAAGLVAALGLCVTIVSISQSRGQSQNLGQAATFGRTTLQEPEPQVPQAPKQPRILGYNVVAEFPHDKHAFTQGKTRAPAVLHPGTAPARGCQTWTPDPIRA